MVAREAFGNQAYGLIASSLPPLSYSFIVLTVAVFLGPVMVLGVQMLGKQEPRPCSAYCPRAY